MKTLVQENTNSALTALNQDVKKIDYDYDLISGKVNEVAYQAGEADQYYHHYYYDADNRLTCALTSKDNVIWEQDAKYFYYKHGPLARTEIGDKKVQGIDYVYTIQGWQKSINSETLKETRDIGKDGYMSTNLDKHIGRDAYAYTLGYFAGDYIPKAGVANAPAIAAVASSDMLAARNNLFNGNISYMGTTLVDPTAVTTPLPNAMAYKYDQLNRIKYAQGYSNLDITDNTWDYGSSYTGKYYNEYTYDFNGNIDSVSVKNNAGTAIDNQKYHYVMSGLNKLNNRLLYINDVAGTTGGYDLADQNTANYDYTEIGELKEDVLGEIDNIVRRIDGKIKEIIRASGTKKNLKFDYDVTGNRVAKHVYSNASVWEQSEYYVLDAQGNIMSTYVHTDPGTESFKLTERHIYGSSLIGMDADETEMIGASVSSSAFDRTLGLKKYSGSNHLGNVLTTFSDRKVANNTSTTVNFYSPDVISTNDQGVFGESLTNRVFTPNSYPNSFNGKRDDEEVDGWQNYGFRNYLKYTRRLMDRVDPITSQYPELSPYQFASNTPIQAIDLDGLEATLPSEHWDVIFQMQNEESIKEIARKKAASEQKKYQRATISAPYDPAQANFDYNFRLYGPVIIPGYTPLTKAIAGEEITKTDWTLEAIGIIPFLKMGKLVGPLSKMVNQSGMLMLKGAGKFGTCVDFAGDFMKQLAPQFIEEGASVIQKQFKSSSAWGIWQNGKKVTENGYHTLIEVEKEGKVFIYDNLNAGAAGVPKEEFIKTLEVVTPEGYKAGEEAYKLFTPK